MQLGCLTSDHLCTSSVAKYILLVKELQNLPVHQRNHMLQMMPLSLAEKRRLRLVPLSLVRVLVIRCFWRRESTSLLFLPKTTFAMF